MPRLLYLRPDIADFPQTSHIFAIMFPHCLNTKYTKNYCFVKGEGRVLSDLKIKIDNLPFLPEDIEDKNKGEKRFRVLFEEW